MFLFASEPSAALPVRASVVQRDVRGWKPVQLEVPVVVRLEL